MPVAHTLRSPICYTVLLAVHQPVWCLRVPNVAAHIVPVADVASCF